MAGVLAVKALVFASATAALFALGRRGLSVGFAAVALTNTAIAAFDRDARVRAARND
jgi:hypothetical protein